MACNWGYNYNGCNHPQKKGCTCLANDVRNLINELEDAFYEFEQADCIRPTQNNCGCNNNCCNNNCCCNRGCGCGCCR